jgi:hypothetical protein
LCWAAAHKTGDTAGVARLEQTLITTLESPVLHDLILQAVAGSLKLNYLSRSEPSSPGQAIDGLVRACELFRTLDRPFVVPSALLAQVEKNLEDASPAQLHSLCAGGLRMGWPTLTYAASGQGLAQGGPLVYRFLLARGQVLCTCGRPHEQERARQCLRAAHELASRARDREAVREASTALDALPDWGAFDALMSDTLAPPDETPLTQEEIAHVIDRERGMRKVPHFPLTRAPRKPRKPKSPRRRLPHGLLDELFSLLEGRL